jgi:hypothetical protein
MSADAHSTRVSGRPPPGREGGQAPPCTGQLSPRAARRLRRYRWLTLTRGQLGAVARLDIEDALGVSFPAKPQLRLYLHRRGRTELVSLSYGDVGRGGDKAWVVRALVPTLVRAGRFEVIALVFVRLDEDRQMLTPICLHVLDCQHHDGWTSQPVDAGQRASLGWRRDTPEPLDARAVREITRALIPRRPAVGTRLKTLRRRRWARVFRTGS